MAAEEQLTATSYIKHHLTNLTHPIGQGSFWTLNVDTVVVSLLLGIIGFGTLWWIVRGVTPGVPNKRQAFVELAFSFVDDQVKGIFHGDRHAFIAPLALTVFVWVLLLNAMDFLPVDITGLFYEHVLHLPYWRQVATADVNTTRPVLSVLSLMTFSASR
jgi:F-type H+-transporting ATPase subunit a